MFRLLPLFMLLLTPLIASAEQVTFVDQEGRWPSGGLDRQGPADLTSPSDLTSGPVYVRYDVRGKPTDIRTVAQVCIWQDGSSRETCDTLVEYHEPGVYYAKIRPLSAWWVKNPENPPDFSRAFQNFRFVHKGHSTGGGWLDTCGGAHCMGGAAAPHLPIEYRLEMILTSEGHAFVPPSHWEGCPRAVCGAHGDAGAGAAGSRILVFHGGASSEHAAANDRGPWEIRSIGVERDFLVDTTTDEEKFTPGVLAAYNAVMLLNTEGDTLSADKQQILEAWYRAGGGLVLVHGAAGAEPDWPWLQSLLGTGASHVSGGSLAAAGEHPATEGLGGSITAGPFYTFASVPSDAAVFLTGDSSPAGWAREVEGGRVIYVPVGHDRAAVESESFHTLLGNAIEWAIVGGEGGAQAAPQPQPQPQPEPQPQPKTGPCHLIESGMSVPQGYAAPYNVHSGVGELLMKITCLTSSALIEVGNGSNLLYVYARGFYWAGTGWQPYELTPLVGGARDGDWLIGTGRVTLPGADIVQSGNNYVVAYTCLWTRASWQCGCRDAACADDLWQVQVFRLLN